MAQRHGNPYINRAMLRSVDEFFGRREDVDWILARAGAASPNIRERRRKARNWA